MKHLERIEDYREPNAEAIGRDSEEAFLKDGQAQDAIIRNIMVIGEAADPIHQIDPTFVAQRAGLPWLYFGVDWQSVLGTVKTDLPALRLNIEQTLADARRRHEERALGQIAGIRYRRGGRRSRRRAQDLDDRDDRAKFDSPQS